ncbi:GyrI-like domain-containing protein [Lutimonas halocynthiae]|uniref:GyrI-like domain-containing protein n=1 Tax=Lutimonas halocynthiae TaxID=1446477 RepID=UPI0025B43C47|nr:GyrI-like domain-containing protein [Lutimonas halocynthiae]MDN3641389.1 GyrI-like domain-containing protein [Lutimonas halocynthiae]
MFDRIEKLEKKLLCGLSLKMSFTDNKTYELWSSFMPLRKKVTNAASTDLYSMQIYGEILDYNKLNPTSTFTKWAAVEVKDHSKIPEELFPYELNEGLYAVFIHKGTPQDFPKTFAYIFENWIPNSKYEVDYREHFELIPETYKPDDPNAKEEVWIPILEKT